MATAVVTVLKSTVSVETVVNIDVLIGIGAEMVADKLPDALVCIFAGVITDLLFNISIGILAGVNVNVSAAMIIGVSELGLVV